MWSLIGLFLALALADPQASTCSTSVAPGLFSYTVGSTATTGYLIQAGGTNSWGPVSSSGSQITIGKGPRFYLANSCASSFSGTVFSAVKLLGGSITFTVDISSIGCGLNAAFYLVSMPASSSGQNGDYYCDANSVGGVACSEMDLFEANRHAIQITPHRCTSSTSCDPNGCAKNTQSISKGFGPDSSFTINSLSSFTVKISFAKGSDGTLSGITSLISQGSKSITLTHGSECGSGYLSLMGTALNNGMVPVWSYWGGSMSWLDSPACSNDNPEVTGNFLFSNLIVGGSVISTTGPPAVPSVPVSPVPAGSQVCTTTGCTNNVNWVEFNAPSGVSGGSATGVTVKCSNNMVYPCTWQGTKFGCGASGSPPSGGCSTITTITVNGKPCYLQASSAISDSTAETTFGSDQPLIIGLSVGIAVTILVILVLIVVIFIRKQTGTYIETV